VIGSPGTALAAFLVDATTDRAASFAAATTDVTAAPAASSAISRNGPWLYFRGVAVFSGASATRSFGA
jgi:hypothetical protein